jgi:hypothetical protein
MQKWYEQQDFYTEEKCNAIKSWVRKNTLDFMNDNLEPDKAVA